MSLDSQNDVYLFHQRLRLIKISFLNGVSKLKKTQKTPTLGKIPSIQHTKNGLDVLKIQNTQKNSTQATTTPAPR